MSPASGTLSPPAQAQSRHAPGRRAAVLVLVSITVLQFFQTILHFEPVSGILNDEPIYPFDYSIGYYLIESGRQRFEATGRFHGYDPFFMAGYPEVYLENNHILLTLLATASAPVLSSALLIKLFYIVCLTLAPLCFFAALRNFDVGIKGSLAGTLLAFTYIRVGEFVYTETGGSLCGMLVFVFGLPYLSLYYRFLKYGERTSALLLLVLTPLLALLHKSFAVIMPLPLLALCLSFRDRFRPAHVAFYAGVGIVTFAANAFWLLPCIRGLGFVTSDPAPFWLSFDPLKVFADYLTDRAGFSPVILHRAYGTVLTRDAILIFALLGARLLWKEGDRRLFLFLATSVLWFFLFAYFGSSLRSLRHLEPYRYSIWMNFLLLVPASRYLDAFVSPRQGQAAVPVRWPAAARISLLLAAALLLNSAPSCHRLLHLHPRRVVAEGYLDSFLGLENWILDHTDTASRILIEDTYAPFLDTRQGPYMDSYPLGILALDTGREFVSGRYPFYRISFRFASFSEGVAFGRPLSTVDPAVFRRYLDLYNCGWVIACTRGSVRALKERFEFLRAEAEIGPFVVFRLLEPRATYFLKGGGSVTASLHGIFLRDLRPEDGEIIIKYHYVPGLRSEPKARLEEVRLSDDPHGFIRIIDPPPAMRLEFP